ncbi:MAG: winged helix-turn-helix transcriptional regulator, partial [Candidatus Woesearchaeota archaeon]
MNNEIKIRILRQFCKTDEESSGRQIAEQIKASPAACHKALQELCFQKILNLKSVGNSHLYSLNSKNIITDTMLKPIFDKESQTISVISKVIKNIIV